MLTAHHLFAVKLNLIVLLFLYTVYCLKATSQDFSTLVVVQTEERGVYGPESLYYNFNF